MKKIIPVLFLLFCGLHASDASYVGEKACVSCHESEFKEWKGSHHDMSMMVADSKSVKADFNNTTFDYNGMITTFTMKDGKYMVNTEGLDGKYHDYEIVYTFGIYPLQQYMIKFPDGKIQILDPTWDSRSKEEGGQRWFHIHKDDNVTVGGVLHWTGPNMNWNYMCADCHSTNLKKNYDPVTKKYDTKWDIINVSCEACHGPASKHIEWTKAPHKDLTHKGFSLSFKNKKFKWDINTKEKLSVHGNQEMEVCAKCHSRRAQLDDDFKPGDKFSDHYLASKLDEGLYFPDGKIDDEVYVYNSFLQSKMYQAGVTCTDCHNAHTLNRKSKGDKVCYTCHTEEKYTATEHHKHKKGSTGSSCVSCHMPARTYMGVDSRNDHSFRVPRPDISVEYKDVPNACNLCHDDKDAKWSTDAMKKWYGGKIPVGKQNFAHSLQALRTNAKSAPKELYNILTSDAPELAKITAVDYLGNYPSRQTYTTVMQMLRKSNPQMRRSALIALAGFPTKMRLKYVFDMIDDPSTIVRMEAARQLSSFPEGQLNDEQKVKLNKAFDEYEKILLFNAERPEYQVSLGIYYYNRKMPVKAEKAYKEAIRLQKKFVPAYINYSDFLVKENREKEAFDVLKEGIANVPDMSVLHHTLGLWYIRNKDNKKALVELEKATKLDDTSARFIYVYAVAVAAKDVPKAIDVLEKAYKTHNGSLEIVSALAYYYKEIGNNSKSEEYNKKLKELQNFSVN
ncbi:probable deca-heme c-type cytochrome [hydrothermal vent metagenome]|uniref:Probable deca-heme c-type cytochrome n=1 Tax=hydrothermal vent metagenome TaxID=652676 RepID=A0A1W1EE05_9ZZZZ